MFYASEDGLYAYDLVEWNKYLIWYKQIWFDLYKKFLVHLKKCFDCMQSFVYQEYLNYQNYLSIRSAIEYFWVRIHWDKYLIDPIKFFGYIVWLTIFLVASNKEFSSCIQRYFYWIRFCWIKPIFHLIRPKVWLYWKSWLI